MPINVYQKGDRVRLSGIFRDIAGALVDPGVVRFKFTKPDGVQTTYTHGTDPELVRLSQGSFQVDLSVDKAGPWYYAWESTGNGQAAEPGQFMVEGI